MNKTKIFIALSASTLIAAPALAQSAAPAAPSGARVEALVGYDAVKGLGDTRDGVLYGVGAGYDVPVATSFSLGADIEATDSTTKETVTGGTIETGRDLYAGARATLALSDTANVYIKGGYTNARAKAETTIGNFSDNAEGWRAGIGTQFAVSGKAYVGGEYRFSRYDEDAKRHQLALTVGTRF